MSGPWTVKFDARVRPIIEAIAHEEQRDAAQVVRRLVDSALAQRALSMRPAPAPVLTDPAPHACSAQRRA